MNKEKSNVFPSLGLELLAEQLLDFHAGLTVALGRPYVNVTSPG